MFLDSLVVIVQDVFLKSKLVDHKGIKVRKLMTYLDCYQTTFHQLTMAINILI